MSLASIGGMLRWPMWWYHGSSTGVPSLSSATIDATADRLAVLFQAPKAGDLDRMEFEVTGGSSLLTLRCGWQDVSLTTGFPDGTFDQYADLSSYSAAWQTPSYFGASGGGSGARRTVAQGDLVAFVISGEQAGGTPNVTIGQNSLGTSGRTNGMYFPSTVQNLTGSYAVAATAQTCALYYSGESSPTPFNSFLIVPFTASSTQSFSTGNPRQVGMKFTLPFKSRCIGAFFFADVDNDLIVRLYDSDAVTDLVNSGSGLTFDKDLPGASTTIQMNEVIFPNAVTLSANTAYRLALENTSATACALQYIDVNAASHLSAWPGGQALHWTQADLAKASLVNDASWTQTTTRRPFMGILIDQLDDGASAAGGGGIRLAGHGGLAS